MRYLIGVCAALVLALGLVAWQLKNSWQANEQLRARAAAAEEASDLLDRRFAALDEAMVDLATSTRKNAERLTVALGEIENITQQPEDSDETISCLGLPVPRDLDRILRQPAADRVPTGDDS